MSLYLVFMAVLCAGLALGDSNQPVGAAEQKAPYPASDQFEHSYSPQVSQYDQSPSQKIAQAAARGLPQDLHAGTGLIRVHRGLSELELDSQLGQIVAHDTPSRRHLIYDGDSLSEGAHNSYRWLSDFEVLMSLCPVPWRRLCASSIERASQVDPNELQRVARKIRANPLAHTRRRLRDPRQALKPRIQELKRLIKYIHNLSQVPKFGVEIGSKQEVVELIEQIDTWGLDIFELHRLSRGHSLTVVMYKIFKERNLLQTFDISARKLVNYLLAIEAHYRDNPYHSSMHAADVVQTVHMLLLSPTLDSVFTDLEIMTALFAAAIHDVDHPGLTNQYLINTSDELALRYNNESVLENHSLAVAFELLQGDGCNFLKNLNKKQRQTLRRMTTDMVLATDMSKHMSLLADLKTMVKIKGVAGNGILLLDDYTERILVLQSMLHCADVSNPTKPLDIYRQWAARVVSEFHLQGDIERSQNLTISPLCDRFNANFERSQVSFIDYIVHPLWETWAELVYPDAKRVLKILEDNREWFASQLPPDNPPSNTSR